MKRTILVVDDSQSARQQMALALTPAGFAVLEAVDGADVLVATIRKLVA